MKNYIALLRAVNVGGRGKISMADLRACLIGLRFSGVQTVLQSGNVVLATEKFTGKALESFLENNLLMRLGLRTSVIVRSAAEWAEVVAGNPLVSEARNDPSHLLAILARQAVTSKVLGELQTAVAKAGGREVVAESRGQVYLYFPAGIGRSRVTNTLIERALGGPVTGRNWNTVLKLAELVAAGS